jgi:hypothetical protein
MRELQSVLAKRELATMVSFDPLNHRIWCYAHIINICSSHIIASMTSTPASYLAQLKVPRDSNYTTHGGSDDESDDDDDPHRDFDELDLCSDLYEGLGSAKLKSWVAGIRRDPLRRARRLVRILRASDERRRGLQQFIQDGNERGWFTTTDDNGKRTKIQVPALQLLRDVKTRWDSVFMMLQRLRHLRPVRWSR